jgi:hypothetical protein
MNANQPEKRRKKITLVANSAWSVYNFRIDLIRHLLLRFEVLIIAPRMLAQSWKCRLFLPDIRFNNRSENPLKDYILYRSLKIYRTENRILFFTSHKPNIMDRWRQRLRHTIRGGNNRPGLYFDKQNPLNRIVSVLYRRSLIKASEVWLLTGKMQTFY